MTWETRTVTNESTRRLARPPVKSAVPQESAARRPKRTTAPVTASGVGDNLVRFHVSALVDAGRPWQLDDEVGDAVVAIRRREVEDLEVRGELAEESERTRRSLAVERHEGIVEHERRPAVARHEPHEPEARREVHEIEGPARELADRDPVTTLRREDLDPEVGVVHPHPAVAAFGHPVHVADHPSLEVAGRLLHRGLLGLLDRPERGLEHASPALERHHLLAPHSETLGEPGDILGVDRVVVDARTSVGLGVACLLECLLLFGDLDLETLAGPRLLGDRAQRLERLRLALDLERGRITNLRQGLGRFLADEAV